MAVVCLRCGRVETGRQYSVIKIEHVVEGQHPEPDVDGFRSLGIPVEGVG